VTFGGSDTKSGTAVVVIGVDLPAKNVQSLDKENIALVCGEIQSELFV
jgi:hypothetical protein